MTASLAPAGIRARLLGTIALVVTVALALMTLAFNIVLRDSLDDDAANLAHARAATALARVRLTSEGLSLAPGAGAAGSDAQIWIFDRHGRVTAPSSASAALGRTAGSLAGGPSRFIEDDGTRMYATPIVENGARAGTVVVGVGLRAYEQTARTALLGSIAFALLLFALVIAASRWLLRHALQPVAEMTSAAADWSEHQPERRFARGAPHDELTSLAATLDSLLDRLATSLRREQRFSAEMSHELRTPLARIHAEVELALTRERALDEYRDALAAIGRSAEQMTRTVDALVTAARQAAQPARGSADAHRSLTRAIEATRPTRNVIIPRLDAPDPAIRIAADEDVIERIVAPLLENACRHAATDATVRVSRDATSVFITISDDGPGISAVELEHIFQPGTRGSTATHADGAGLGLALARRLARAAGGEITAEPGPGGRFVARLPAV